MFLSQKVDLKSSSVQSVHQEGPYFEMFCIVLGAAELCLQAGLAAKLTRRLDWGIPTNCCLILLGILGFPATCYLFVAAESKYKAFSRYVVNNCKYQKIKLNIFQWKFVTF
ncbi:hypothetical protein ILYODFUR_020461 [Ilyodon furcidens]|uniref:Uncharacterized protein n=1 Tax=Ilyodon furcidens TaxID=33524 RepID=A0ABV0SMX8_9TELE